jgi:hypothetical protein
MVDGLDQFVKLDVPFLRGERGDRVASMYSLIESTEVNDANKLRQILNSWMIEVQGGREFHAYREENAANLPPGLPAEVGGRDLDFIALGRVGLMFQTADEELTGAWDYRNNSWVVLGSEYRNPIRQALRMARNQIAPELTLLPSVPPQLN